MDGETTTPAEAVGRAAKDGNFSTGSFNVDPDSVEAVDGLDCAPGQVLNNNGSMCGK